MGLAALAVVLAAVGGVVLIVQEQWTALTEIFEQSTDGLGESFMGLVKAIGGFLAPLLKMTMTPLVIALTAAFTVMTPILKLIVEGWRLIFEVLAYGANFIYDTVKPAFDAIFGFFATLAGWLNRLGRAELPGDPEERLRRGGIKAGKRYMEEAARTNDEFMKNLAAQVGEGGRGGLFGEPTEFQAQMPMERPTVVNDFRGSKITVKQEFREADPDRVMIQMIEDINKQAEMRIRTGFAPALGG